MLKEEIGWLEGVERATKPKRLPVRAQPGTRCTRSLPHLHGTPRLMAGLLYGSGLRLMECVRLRVKDIDFGYRQIMVRDAKGAKDRVTMLPRSTVEPLKRQLAMAKAMHEADVAAGVGEVELPHALARKYPRAPFQWAWKFVFPSPKLPPIREAA